VTDSSHVHLRSPRFGLESPCPIDGVSHNLQSAGVPNPAGSTTTGTTDRPTSNPSNPSNHQSPAIPIITSAAIGTLPQTILSTFSLRQCCIFSFPFRKTILSRTFSQTMGRKLCALTHSNGLKVDISRRNLKDLLIHHAPQCGVSSHHRDRNHNRNRNRNRNRNTKSATVHIASDRSPHHTDQPTPHTNTTRPPVAKQAKQPNQNRKPRSNNRQL
jgi:hypothetical protein